jgi:uncharacterized LabA/DUF88 family protein
MEKDFQRRQKKGEVNYAFIDSQNLNLGIRAQGWRLDYRKFRVYLKEKYGVSKAFLFLGYIPKNQQLYDALKQYGYEIIFKPVLLHHPDGVKGNVDAELVLQTMHEYNTYEKAVIVSGDGDFYCLVKYLFERNKLARLIVPDKRKYSVLLRRSLPRTESITFLSDLRKRLAFRGFTIIPDAKQGE